MNKIILSISILFGCLLFSTGACGLDLMLAKVYEGNIDVSGWLVSEKLDGVRGYWDGKILRSKTGRPFTPPAAFTRNFPEFALEGEIWGGRGTFEQTISTVKKKQENSGWFKLKFAIFDVPEGGGSFTERLAKAKGWFVKHPSDHVFIIPQLPVQSDQGLQAELVRIERLGGEGLIVRRADALYHKGRSREILKVKSYLDAEAVVLAHLPGKGRNIGRLGALLVELPDGTSFKVGSGFTDKERITPPPIGSIITFKYYGKYKSGIPKFPSFMRGRQ